MKFAINSYHFNKKIQDSQGREFKTDSRCSLSLMDLKEGEFYIATLDGHGHGANACVYTVDDGKLKVDNNVLWEERVNSNDLDPRNYSEETPSWPAELTCFRRISLDGFYDKKSNLIMIEDTLVDKNYYINNY